MCCYVSGTFICEGSCFRRLLVVTTSLSQLQIIRLWNRSTVPWDGDSQSGNRAKSRSLMRIDREHAMSWWFLLFFNSGFEDCVSQAILSPWNKPQSWAQTAIGRYRRFDFRLFGLIRASPRWLVLELAIAVVDQFNCPNAERLRMHIKMYVFLRNFRQIKLPVLDAHGAQITRLYLKYNAFYYIATT